MFNLNLRSLTNISNLIISAGNGVYIGPDLSLSSGVEPSDSLRLDGAVTNTLITHSLQVVPQFHNDVDNFLYL